MARTGPPAYAWDWFARQRLLWRETRTRLVATASPAAIRYRGVEGRADVMALLRADYPRDDLVRTAVDGTVAELAFLGRTDVPFASLRIRTPPRGLRWWWAALTGEDVDAATTTARPVAGERHQLSLQLLDADDLSPEELRARLHEVHEGYGR